MSEGKMEHERLTAEVARASIYFGCPLDASLGRCSRHVPLGGGPGKTQDTLERLCLMVPPEELEEEF
ncbi:hypothetical protein L3Q82_015632, partial [Scortum barcoo]